MTVTDMTSGTNDRLCRSLWVETAGSSPTEGGRSGRTGRYRPVARGRREGAAPAPSPTPRPHGGHAFGPPAEETAKVGACSVVLRPFGRTPPPRGECAADAHAAVGPRARPRPHAHHHRSCSNGDGGRLSATTPRPLLLPGRLRRRAQRPRQPPVGAPQPPARGRHRSWH